MGLHGASRRGACLAGVLGGTLAAGCVSAPAPVTRIGDAGGTSNAAVLPSRLLVDLRGDQALAYEHTAPEYGRRDRLVLPSSGEGYESDLDRQLEARWQRARFDFDRRDLLWWVRRVPFW